MRKKRQTKTTPIYNISVQITSNNNHRTSSTTTTTTNSLQTPSVFQRHFLATKESLGRVRKERHVRERLGEEVGGRRKEVEEGGRKYRGGWR